MMNFKIALSLIFSLIILFVSCENSTNPDETPPSVIITFPIDGSVISELVKITCVATDNKGIKKVQLFVDGYVIEGVEDNQEPYELYWNTQSYDNHSAHNITIRAIDKNNNQMDSEPVVLNIDNTNAFPTRINIKSIIYQDSSFIILWSSSNDQDFGSYHLYEGYHPDMSDKTEIFFSTNKADISVTVENVDENEKRYYQLAVKDSLGFETLSSIRRGISDFMYSDFVYSEDFETPLYFGQYELVNDSCFINEGRDGWKAYAEDHIPGYSVSTSWNWEHYKDFQSDTSWIRGITSTYEIGTLWLFKSVQVNKDKALLAKVKARTIKIHNGTDTGPRLYVFDGIVDYPSNNLTNILDSDYFTWGAFDLSPWVDLFVTCYPTQDYVTVAIRVRDRWDRYAIYHEYDSLNMYYLN